ncbi:MAG: macro domain-containing protein [Deltaproteobacteria bacterium]|nr:macro domain-containing protein [Deltaproteobacteria bacterium]
MTWKTHVSLLQGDITDADVDAIVNAANTELQLGAGVAGAIRRKGGPTIQHACDAHGPVPLGEAALTNGGNLTARYVIHAASMHLGGLTSEDSLRAATMNSLKRATEKQLTSIAFPAVGTGIAGFPLARCATIMLEEVRKHLSTQTSLQHMLFVLFDAAALRVFQQTLATMPDGESNYIG